MRIVINTDTNTLQSDSGEVLDLYGPEAFELISQVWLRASWNLKYSYTFTWLGRPIIQHPEDMLRLQEVIFSLRPDVVIETGVAHGGSLIFYASLMKAMGTGGRVVGIDIDIRQANRRAIEAHPLSGAITLIEGDSAAPDVAARAAALVSEGDTVLVILDSDHSYRHVMRELEAYHGLVSPNSYILATDGIMRLVSDVPRGKTEWETDNPANAAEDFARAHPEFVIEEPRWLFNESPLRRSITAWPSAWIRRVGPTGL